jgi:hypothetical protein
MGGGHGRTAADVLLAHQDEEGPVGAAECQYAHRVVHQVDLLMFTEVNSINPGAPSAPFLDVFMSAS